MTQKLEAAFEYFIDHPEAIMLIGGMLFALISILTVPFDSGTTWFIRILSAGLIVCGVVLYVLRLGFRLVFRMAYNEKNRTS